MRCGLIVLQDGAGGPKDQEPKLSRIGKGCPGCPLRHPEKLLVISDIG